MATLTIPRDFKEFLRLLDSHRAEFLIIGGYAVSLHGYVRATNDLDIWVGTDPRNGSRVNAAVREFGFTGSDLAPELFTIPGNVIRMGVPPIRLEILTSISGAGFDECYAERRMVTIDELTVPVISLSRLRQNKASAGRAKDIADLENLPPSDTDTDAL